MLETCKGCGGAFKPIDGTTHAYMLSSPACYAAFCDLLAAEYSTPELMAVHRLTVDTYAVQHPGSDTDRRAVQSVGLHLARLMLQLTRPQPPAETNAVMLNFSKHKATLKSLDPPARFSITVADVAPFAGTAGHGENVREWAAATWRDWSSAHDYITQWVDQHASCRR
jgi:Family of unknown function (DUF5946)